MNLSGKTGRHPAEAGIFPGIRFCFYEKKAADILQLLFVFMKKGCRSSAAFFCVYDKKAAGLLQLFFVFMKTGCRSSAVFVLFL